MIGAYLAGMASRHDSLRAHTKQEPDARADSNKHEKRLPAVDGKAGTYREEERLCDLNQPWRRVLPQFIIDVCYPAIQGLAADYIAEA